MLEAAIKSAQLMADAFHGLMISISDSMIEDRDHADEDMTDELCCNAPSQWPTTSYSIQGP